MLRKHAIGTVTARCQKRNNMWLSDIMMALLSFTIIGAAWIFMFFVFDEMILKGYFKNKLQKRFKVEE
jgi:hypothetical protein